MVLTRRMKNHDPKASKGAACSFSNALSDKDSELSKFLLMSGDDRDPKTMPSIGSIRGWIYCLSLEPKKVRSERIVLLFEAYAIFSALFLSGTWIIYEWGSALAYGGQQSELLSDIFETTMILAMSSNVILAMFASMMWMMSLNFCTTNPDWEYNCRYMVLYCEVLFGFMLILASLGLNVAILHKFYPNETMIIVTFVLLILMEIPGFYYAGKLVTEELPLEYYHSAFWLRLMFSPISVLIKNRREGIRERAIHRAQYLRDRFCKESTNTTVESLEDLLKMAANKIGRCDLDVSVYVARLEADLYTDAEHLLEENVDTLSLYMPRRLAKEVERILSMGLDKRFMSE